MTEESVVKSINGMPKDVLISALLDLAWDCQSGWIDDDDDVHNWDEERIRSTSVNIINSLTTVDDE